MFIAARCRCWKKSPASAAALPWILVRFPLAATAAAGRSGRLEHQGPHRPRAAKRNWRLRCCGRFTPQRPPRASSVIESAKRRGTRAAGRQASRSRETTARGFKSEFNSLCALKSRRSALEEIAGARRRRAAIVLAADGVAVKVERPVGAVEDRRRFDLLLQLSAGDDHAQPARPIVGCAGRGRGHKHCQGAQYNRCNNGTRHGKNLRFQLGFPVIQVQLERKSVFSLNHFGHRPAALQRRGGRRT